MRAIYQAYLERGARETQRYELALLDHLIETREALIAGRVVHHLLVSRLETLYETRFIHDSYANRRGHARGSGPAATVPASGDLQRPAPRLVSATGYSRPVGVLRFLRPRAKPATRPELFRLPLRALAGLRQRLRRQGIAHRFIAEEGYLRGGLKRRVLRLIWRPASPLIPFSPSDRTSLSSGRGLSASTPQESSS